MNDEIVHCVSGITNAFHKGTEKAQKICKVAVKNASSASSVLETIEPAQALQKSLADSEAQVKYAYSQSVSVFGRTYPQAILDDPVMTNNLQSLTINLQEQLNTLGDYFEDPDTFDLGSLQYIQRGSERSRDHAIQLLGSLHQRMLSVRLQQFRLPRQDDRTNLPSQQEPAVDRPPSQISPMHAVNPQSFAGRAAAIEKGPTYRINSPSHYDANIRKEMNSPNYVPTATSPGSCKSEQRLSAPRAEALSGSLEESPLKLIDSAEVIRHATSIDNFLAKRQMSRATYHQDMENTRPLSTNSTSTTSTRPSFAHPSPGHTYTDHIVASPIQSSRPNSTLLMTRSQSREGQATLSPGGPSPRNSAALSPERQVSSGSEVLIFGPPDSPPISSGRQSATDGFGQGLAHTLKLPRYGEGVDDEKEVVGQVVSDPGLMLASEVHDQPTPATSVQSIEWPISHDTSFYKYSGFCQGANMLRQGATALKVIKKPGAHLIALVSMKCVECRYEIGFDVYDRDNFLDKAGIYSIGDIHFRQRFLSKCHLPAKNTDDSAYACIFCIEDGRTVDDYDATVFFSVTTFFRHLQKHTRPVKVVEGITVVYGPQTDTLDFDIHFKTMDPKPSPFANIAGSFKDHPTAHAIADHRERSKGYKSRDPEGRPTLQFALGARIVGITYSERTKGEWCFGYHDGDKGYFPASAIALDPPTKYNMTMNRNSRLWATAKWEHKPKEANPAWLVFNKKDKITNIAFPYEDSWWWTGHYKGKWGLFPACYVEKLTEEPNVPGQGPISGRQASGDASPWGSHHHHGLSSFLKHRTTENSTS